MPTITIEYEGGEGHEEKVSQKQASFIDTYLRVNMELPANDNRGAKSLAQQIREQLEREGMTVKQILTRNYLYNGRGDVNVLTSREARRREVERAAEIVREREPSDPDSNNLPVGAYYNHSGQFSCVTTVIPNIADFYMQSVAQWSLLREVIGDEELNELIQK